MESLSQQNMYASDDGRKIAIFEKYESNKCLMFEYLKDENVVRATIMRGEDIQGCFDIDIDNNLLGRKHEGVIGITHYFERVLSEINIGEAS